jgi:ornithine decarboxylase
MNLFSSSLSFVLKHYPVLPTTCLRPQAAIVASEYFQHNFPGTVLYAVKSNPRFEILDSIYRSGINHFDVASISETRLVSSRFPNARLSYMHPVKSRESICEAYFEYGVRDFALDSYEELEKIYFSTNNASDLNLFIRLSVPNDYAKLNLSNKFGIQLDKATSLLKSVRAIAQKVGVCFHVGSQCMNPKSFVIAIHRVGDLIRSSGIMLDILDVGGGFPSSYIDLNPPPLDTYIEEISGALMDIPIRDDCEIWAEPGRALVAEAASTLVRVEHRKDNYLYINDGIYGSLFDAGLSGFIHPVQSINIQNKLSNELIPFSFFGPTCDGMDFMKGPYMLPDNITEGDYIEIGQTGAYGCTMRTKFNGFYSDEAILLTDLPIVSLYGQKNGFGQSVNEIAL